MAWQRLGDLCCATLGSSVPLHHPMVKPSIPVAPQPAQGCTPGSHAPPRVVRISPEGTSKHVPPPQQIICWTPLPKIPPWGRKHQVPGHLLNAKQPVSKRAYQTHLAPLRFKRDSALACPCGSQGHRVWLKNPENLFTKPGAKASSWLGSR